MKNGDPTKTKQTKTKNTQHRIIKGWRTVIQPKQNKQKQKTHNTE